MTRTLYPGKVEPILTPAQRPEQVTESRWHQPWSEPSVKTKRGVSFQSFEAFVPVITQTGTGTLLWYQQLSWVMSRVALIGAG